ncbi:hypothetical protein QBC41DRAFT_327268 [Cercophora samala]|uniref:Uncharacterized protein n=1 Tax=Cercophora samala TaxID=330535 RepID=A0AA39Z7Q9_9PEZI|nr:hypothetical protein QBC41DRAFT_327268 [Cercophora samala]
MAYIASRWSTASFKYLRDSLSAAVVCLPACLHLYGPAISPPFPRPQGREGPRSGRYSLRMTPHFVVPSSPLATLYFLSLFVLV